MNKDKSKKIKLVIEEEEPNEIEEESNEIEVWNKCKDIVESKYTDECNKFLLKKELLEYNELKAHPDSETYLYPNLNDPNFNIKIAEKKEFNDTKYDGELKDIKTQAEILSKADFELSPHQAFVRNFLSFQTPYNSLLLYHGLGSGKTCSAIGVCEEMRDYLKQMGINKRIIIVASPNVQDNFRLQLFDERKLKKVDGLWNIRSCTGNKLLKEINPMNMKEIPKEKIISQIKTLINAAYLFLGYGEFANYIRKIESVKEDYRNEKDKQAKMIRNLRNEFNSRLIVIDEVHNIRISEDNENKKVAMYLMNLVKAAENMRLLLLSATPMYNSYKEIIWLIDLMNINDKRGSIKIRDVFDQNGNFKPDGEELLARKATGYVSFVRGDNPYTFPFRVFPDVFDPKNTFRDSNNAYPKYQMNGKEIKEEDKLKILDANIFLTKIGSYQTKGYRYIIDHLRKKQITITTQKGVVRDMPSFENMESFGYTLLQMPLEALNIVYPLDILEEVVKDIPPISAYSDEKLSETSFSSDSLEIKNKKAKITKESESTKESEKVLELTRLPSSEQSIESLNPLLKSGGDSSSSSPDNSVIINPHDLTGRKGLERTMNFIDKKTPPEFGSFEYKKDIEKKYGKIFSPNEIGKYSSKIKSICENIVSSSGKISEGIILIYSQYISGGLLPIALALEEMGFARFGQNVKPLFKNPPTPVIDVRTMKPIGEKNKDFMPARYVMITGDPRISPNNDFEVKALTSEGNEEGNKIKIVLISKAGSEGVDLKFIRQVHILEPWYNMNRTEQIIGRAVRNLSHKDLPFEKRNVEIFMHGTLLEDRAEESADIYVYRVAEFKALQIGKVSRLLKETSVDCIINYEQNNFTQEAISEMLDTKIVQELSNGKIIQDFKAGDAPYSVACDYMADCQYKCRPFKEITEENLKEDTYNESFIMMNSEKILKKIRSLMKENFFYKKKDLIDRINVPKKYPLVQIYAALTQLIEDNNEFIVDKFGRTGYLINIDEYYLFQPSELSYDHVSIFDRSVPINYKHSMIKFDVNPDISKAHIHVENEVSSEIMQNLKEKFDIAREYTKPNKSINAKDKDDENIWYKYCGIIIRKMAAKGVQLEFLLEFLVEHIIDMMVYKDKLEILNFLYSMNLFVERSFETMAKEYLDKKILKTDRLTAIILYDVDKRKILKLDELQNKWVEAEPEDIKDLAEVIKKSFTIKTTDFNNLVGFIDYEDKKQFLVYKVKNISEKRHTGARCDQKTKAKIISMMNEIEGEEKYTKENTKGIIQAEFCPLQEFTLRYYNKEKRNSKIWFLDPETAKTYGF